MTLNDFNYRYTRANLPFLCRHFLVAAGLTGCDCPSCRRQEQHSISTERTYLSYSRQATSHFQFTSTCLFIALQSCKVTHKADCKVYRSSLSLSRRLNQVKRNPCTGRTYVRFNTAGSAVCYCRGPSVRDHSTPAPSFSPSRVYLVTDWFAPPVGRTSDTVRLSDPDRSPGENRTRAKNRSPFG